MREIHTPTVKRRWSSVLGAAEDFRTDILSFGYDIWKNGDYVRDRMLHKRCLFLFHPTAVEHVLQKHYKIYTKDVFLFRALKVVLGNGLTTSEGDLWLRQRRLLQPFFQRSKLGALTSIMIDSVKQLHQEWQPGETYEMQYEMNKLTLSISVNTLFQQTILDPLKFMERFRGIGPEIASYSRLPFPPLAVPTPRNRRLQHYIHALDQQIQEVIADRRKNPIEENDILQTLIEHNEAQQIRDEMMSLVIAGFQTTALTLSFAFWMIASHPEVEQKLSEEIASILGERELEPSDLDRFSYAKQVLAETLRLYPVSFGLVRQAAKDDNIGGHTVAKGEVVFLFPFFTHRHPDFWKEPEQFLPERFAEPGAARHKYAYIPFGAGPHLCLGNHFALLEALIILVMTIQRYRLSLPTPEYQPELQVMIAMKMNALPLRLEKR
ncbi:MAG: cytochrome P450 [Ktedonobacteraceae bacterium]|nr:cytochrome P450 [Ktedonobacteraceae bacterium]